MRKTVCVILLAWGLVFATTVPSAAASRDYEIVIHGGTSAGVTAAVQASRMGKSVVIVCPEKHLGGLSSGGLGSTDRHRQ